THLQQRWRSLGERFEQHIYVHDDPDLGRRGDNLHTITLAQSVDRAALLDGARVLAELADPRWLAALERDLAAAGLDLGRAVVLERATGLGRIVIAGRGDDVHRFAERHAEAGAAELVAVLIELGGDDVYATTSGAGT